MRMESKQEDDHNNGFNFVFFKRFSKFQSLLFPGIYSLSIGLFGLLLSFALLGILAYLVINSQYLLYCITLI